MSNYIESDSLPSRNGGVTRVTMGADYAPTNVAPQQYVGSGPTRVAVRSIHDSEDLHNAMAAAPVETMRVHTGPIRMTFSGGPEARRVDVDAGGGRARYQHTIDGSVGQRVSETLAYSGTQQTVELQPGNPASRTDVATAIRMGLLRQMPWGTYEDVAAAPVAGAVGPEGQQAQQAEQQSNDAEHFRADEDAEFAAMIDPLPQHAFDAAQAATVALVVNGMGDPEWVVNALAESARMEPEEAAAVLSKCWDYYSTPLVRELGTLGLEGTRVDEALAWAQEHSPNRVQDALQQLMHQRSTKAFRKLAVDFKSAHAGPSIEAFRKVGFDAMVDRATGDILISRDGGRWIPAAAVAANLKD